MLNKHCHACIVAKQMGSKYQSRLKIQTKNRKRLRKAEAEADKRRIKQIIEGDKLTIIDKDDKRLIIIETGIEIIIEDKDKDKEIKG